MNANWAMTAQCAACRWAQRTEEDVRSLRYWLGLAALVATASAPAHRAPGSLTSIEWNAQSGKTEIVHRLHSHDAELGVGEIAGSADLSVLSLEGRATIALYVEERFAIANGSKRLPLDLVGAELVADHLLVYQEWPGRLPDSIRVRDDILRDVFPAQINQVNIASDVGVRTLVFAEDDGWRDFSFSSETG